MYPRGTSITSDPDRGLQLFSDPARGGLELIPGGLQANQQDGGGQVQGAFTATPSGSGGSGTAYDPNELRALDEQKSLYERLLQSAGSTLNSGLQSIGDSYNQQRQRTDQDRSRQLGDLQYKRQQTDTGRESALNRVGDNSRVLRNSLMRILGLASGGGSAFDVADNAVAREATKNRTGVLEDYSSNYRALDRSEEDTQTAFDRLIEDLTSQRRNKEEALRAGVAGQQQSIAERLAAISADRARLLGGDQFAAAAPYRNQYFDIQNQLDSLPGQFRNAVNYTPVTPQAPQLRDYVVDRAAINQNRSAGESRYSPYQQFLRRDEEERAA